MNKAESAALESQFLERSWTCTLDPMDADIVLINTCSVRITAESRAWGRIAHFAAFKKHRAFVLIVTGCMAERLKENMKLKAPGIDYVLGTFQKTSLGVLLDAVEHGKQLDVIDETPEFVFAPSHYEPGAFASFIPIMHGCNNFCSYCIVPYVRGREISRNPLAIKAEIALLSGSGVREITLLGQNVNSYFWQGDGESLDFAGLLSRIAPMALESGIGRIRFVSSHPKDLSPATIDVIARNGIFARHIHLCVQHGSDRILSAMNRGYTSAEYLELVQSIRSHIPEVTLSTDILVGFPGETETDLEATLELMRTVRFAYAFMYHFNPREGTLAASLPDQVPDGVKKQRLARVIELQRQITRDTMRGMLGTEALALTESVSKRNADEVLARTDQDMMVVFRGGAEKIGTFVKVKLVSVRGNTFRAEVLA